MPDTDRELLEMAAKAAGVDAEWHNEDDAAFDAAHDGMFLKGERGPDNSKYWNPLTNDGDALRLAVALRMTVQVVDHEIEVFDFERCLVSVAMSDGDDYQAETRRAIVRAAAAIGKAMDGSDGRERWMGVMEGSDG